MTNPDLSSSSEPTLKEELKYSTKLVVALIALTGLVGFIKNIQDTYKDVNEQEERVYDSPITIGEGTQSLGEFEIIYTK